MSVVTNRMQPRDVSVDNVTAVILWGEGSSGVLNGGKNATCTITVPSGANPNNLTATIWVKSTDESAWVPDTTTVTCPHSASTKIDLVDIIGYAVKITGVMTAGGPYSVTVAAQVML